MWFILVLISSSWASHQEIANFFYEDCVASSRVLKVENCFEDTRGKIILYQYCIKKDSIKPSDEYCKCKALQVGLEEDLNCNLKVK